MSFLAYISKISKNFSVREEKDSVFSSSNNPLKIPSTPTSLISEEDWALTEEARENLEVLLGVKLNKYNLHTDLDKYNFRNSKVKKFKLKEFVNRCLIQYDDSKSKPQLKSWSNFQDRKVNSSKYSKSEQELITEVKEKLPFILLDLKLRIETLKKIKNYPLYEVCKRYDLEARDLRYSISQYISLDADRLGKLLIACKVRDSVDIMCKIEKEQGVDVKRELKRDLRTSVRKSVWEDADVVIKQIPDLEKEIGKEIKRTIKQISVLGKENFLEDEGIIDSNLRDQETLSKPNKKRLSIGSLIASQKDKRMGIFKSENLADLPSYLGKGTERRSLSQPATSNEQEKIRKEAYVFSVDKKFNQVRYGEYSNSLLFDPFFNYYFSELRKGREDADSFLKQKASIDYVEIDQENLDPIKFDEWVKKGISIHNAYLQAQMNPKAFAKWFGKFNTLAIISQPISLSTGIKILSGLMFNLTVFGFSIVISSFIKNDCSKDVTPFTESSWETLKTAKESLINAFSSFENISSVISGIGNAISNVIVNNVNYIFGNSDCFFGGTMIPPVIEEETGVDKVVVTVDVISMINESAVMGLSVTSLFLVVFLCLNGDAQLRMFSFPLIESITLTESYPIKWISKRKESVSAWITKKVIIPCKGWYLELKRGNSGWYQELCEVRECCVKFCQKQYGEFKDSGIGKKTLIGLNLTKKQAQKVMRQVRIRRTKVLRTWITRQLVKFIRFLSGVNHLDSLKSQDSFTLTSKEELEWVRELPDIGNDKLAQERSYLPWAAKRKDRIAKRLYLLVNLVERRGYLTWRAERKDGIAKGLYPLVRWGLISNNTRFKLVNLIHYGTAPTEWVRVVISPILRYFGWQGLISDGTCSGLANFLHCSTSVTEWLRLFEKRVLERLLIRVLEVEEDMGPTLRYFRLRYPQQMYLRWFVFYMCSFHITFAVVHKFFWLCIVLNFITVIPYTVVFWMGGSTVAMLYYSDKIVQESERIKPQKLLTASFPKLLTP